MRPAAPPTGRRPASIPEPGCFMSGSNRSYSMYYLTDTDDASARLGRRWTAGVGGDGGACWPSITRPAKSPGGTNGPAAAASRHTLSTAGKLLFTSNGTTSSLSIRPTERFSGTPV